MFARIKARIRRGGQPTATRGTTTWGASTYSTGTAATTWTSYVDVTGWARMNWRAVDERTMQAARDYAMRVRHAAAWTGRATTPKPKPLPPVDVARFEEVGKLLERVASQNTSVFIAKGQEYRDAHRAGTRRALTAQEAASIAVSVIGDERSPEQLAAAFQNTEGLHAYDEPDPKELLLAAGAATAPAFIAACRSAVALIEMPTAEFWEAVDAGTLDQAVAESANALRRVELPEARARTIAALDHFSEAAGAGKDRGLLIKAVWAGLQQAMMHLSDDSGLSSLISSHTPTSGQPETFSDSATATPSS